MRTTNIIFIFLLLIPIALSADFTAFSDHQDLYACSCSTITDNIYVKNTQSGGELVTYTIGNVSEDQTKDFIATFQTFYLNQEGEAARWATIFPSGFALESGKTQEVNNYVNIPCSAEGSYDLETYIKGDSTQKLIQQVHVKRCDNLDFSMPDSINACPCELQVLELDIENTQDFQDTYSLQFSFPDNFKISVSENRFILESGETKKVYIYVDSDCGTWGKFEIETIITAENNKIEKRKILPVTINPCYDSEVRFGKVQDSINETFAVYLGTYNICEGKEKIIPFEITNLAAFPNDFTFEVPGAIYGKVENLGPNETFTNYITYNAETYEHGQNNLTLEVTAVLGDITEIYAVPVYIDWCYTPSFESDSHVVIPPNTSVISVNLTNYGMNVATYAIDIDAPEWVKLVEKEEDLYYEVNGATLMPDQSKELYLLATPANISEGKYDVMLTASANNVSYQHPMIIQIKGPSIFSAALGFLAKYALYILLALIVLIIILFLLTRKRNTEEKQPVEKIQAVEKTVAVKTPKRSKKKAKKKVVKKIAEEEKKERSWGWIWIPIVIILLLIAAYFLVPPLMQWASTNLIVNQTTGNESTQPENVQTENFTTNESSTVEYKNTTQSINESIETEGIYDGLRDIFKDKNDTVEVANCTFYLAQDQILEFNLSNAFVDPDGDKLYYNYSVSPDNVEVTIDGEMVNMRAIGAFDVEYIEFIADDHNGGEVASGLLTICKGEKSESYLNSIMDMISLYKYYILIGFIFLGLVIILMHHFESKKN